MIISKPIKPDKWIEECKNHFVIILINPCGIDFPDENIIESTQQLTIKNLKANQLDSIINEYPQSNIWRSWMTYSDVLCTVEMSYMPLIIDIDNEQQNLFDAYTLTCDFLSAISKMEITSKDCRVVFSGKKGFHIEVKSVHELDYNHFRQNIIQNLYSTSYTDDKNCNVFPLGTIDVAHEYIRVSESMNSWIENEKIIKRKVSRFSVDEFMSVDIATILKLSESI